MHANYHTDKAHKMKLVYQYYTNGAGIDVLNCDVGCGPDLKTTHELESKVQHSINDGIVGSKKWTDATEGMWAARPGGPPGSKRPSEDPSHCAPPTPWNGAVAGVDRASTLHVVKRGGDGGECGAGVVGDDERSPPRRRRVRLWPTSTRTPRSSSSSPWATTRTRRRRSRLC